MTSLGLLTGIFIGSSPKLLICRYNLIFTLLPWTSDLSDHWTIAVNKNFSLYVIFKHFIAEVQDTLYFNCLVLLKFFIHLNNYNLFEVKGMYFITEWKLQY